MSSVQNINEFPDKILFEIFTHLDQTSFLNASGVCLRWNKVIELNLDFFTSFFGDAEDDGSEPEPEQKLVGPDGEYTEEQAMLAQQVNSMKPNQFYEMVGVSEGAGEDEIRAAYKKLALSLHPDKNKAPGARQAFQALKKAFDAIISGVDPESSETASIDCPDPTCSTTVYIGKEKLNMVNKGTDIGVCRQCKQKFGKIFCVHCYSSWILVLKPEQEGKLVPCINCKKVFSLVYPKQQPARKNAPAAPTSQKGQQQQAVKKRKVNWWEKK